MTTKKYSNLNANDDGAAYQNFAYLIKQHLKENLQPKMHLLEKKKD